VLDSRARGDRLDAVAGLEGMLDEARWCNWKLKNIPRKDGTAKWTKVPLMSGSPVPARVNTTRGCTPYARAQASVLRGDEEVEGVGWFCVGDYTRAYLDIDGCRDPITGEVAAWAVAVLSMCEGAYVEVTPSGTGLRVLGAAGFEFDFSGTLKMAPFLTAQDAEGLTTWGGSRDCGPRAQIEVYFASARYVTVTGWDARGDPLVDIGGVAFELWLLAERQRAATHGARTRGAARAQAGQDRTAPVEDVVAALRVMRQEDEHWDEWSRIGMAAHAASGGDPDVFEAWSEWSAQSVKHDPEACLERWQHWHTSPGTEIGWGALRWMARQADRRWIWPSKACCDEFDVVEDAEAGSAPPPMPDAMERRTGKLAELLAGRVIYVARLHRWMDLESRLPLDEARLRMLGQMLGVGGSMAGGPKSLAARLARADSGMRRVISLTMRPGAGEIVDEDGQACLNTWTPSRLVPLRGAGPADVRPWLDHAERLIPEEGDRRRVLDRMAWALQNPGKKINSALILVGGQETGKDTFLLPFWAAVGEHNLSVVQGAALGGQFNGYLERAWLLVSEMPSARRRDVYEDVKGLLTTPPDVIRINRKGLEEYSVPNVVNVFITSNHEGAMALAEDDRRGDVVATVAAAGGDAAPLYYAELHGWYRRGGREAVAGYLLNRDASAFRPHARPPVTAAKQLMAREGAHPAVTWALGLWDAGRPMFGRDFVTVAELVDKGQAGKWQAGDVVARGLNWGHMLSALRMLQWVVLPQQIVDGDARPLVWARPGVVVLARQLSSSGLKARLVEDRKKSNVVDFD
jgi:hypothetical protein